MKLWKRPRRRPGPWHTVPRSLAQIAAQLEAVTQELRMNRADEWSIPRVLDRRLSEVADELRLTREALQEFDRRWAPLLTGGEALVSALRKKQEGRGGER